VCSFTPSRIGIITSRLTWSKPSLVGTKFAGISLGSAGYWAAGGAGDFAGTGTCAAEAFAARSAADRVRHEADA